MFNHHHCVTCNHKQDDSCERKDLYCKIFVLGQCDLALTNANFVLHGVERSKFSCPNDGKLSQPQRTKQTTGSNHTSNDTNEITTEDETISTG